MAVPPATPLPRTQINPTLPINTQLSLPIPYKCHTTGQSTSASLSPDAESWTPHTQQNSVPPANTTPTAQNHRFIFNHTVKINHLEKLEILLAGLFSQFSLWMTSHSLCRRFTPHCDRFPPIWISEKALWECLGCPHDWWHLALLGSLYYPEPHIVRTTNLDWRPL